EAAPTSGEAFRIGHQADIYLREVGRNTDGWQIGRVDAFPSRAPSTHRYTVCARLCRTTASEDGQSAPPRALIGIDRELLHRCAKHISSTARVLPLFASTTLRFASAATHIEVGVKCSHHPTAFKPLVAPNRHS